ncbi:MAG: GAK system CofD-like protein [Desulfovibrio sp.]|nr:GAK system CofD-like protein [Desulfovibrio sp.]
MAGSASDTPEPALGPRLVLFTGGTALRGLARALARHTTNCAHLVTTFDSGGSSAALRKAFAMPAVGDLRNRLLALADDKVVPGDVLAFCASRLPEEGDPKALRQRLRDTGMADAQAWAAMPPVFAEALRLHLVYFLERMPDDFDPIRACLGNLVLAGGYLHHARDFGPALSFFSRLFRTRGTVLPIANESLHLCALLADGTCIVGQHHFASLPAPVKEIFLTVHEPDRNAPPDRCRPTAAREILPHLRSASAICYPMGSFFSSVLVNLLPRGVGEAIAATDCEKIFIPNSGPDPELRGLTLTDQLRMLLEVLHEDVPDVPDRRLLGRVLVDTRHGDYRETAWEDVRDWLARRGIALTDRDIVTATDVRRHDPEATARALLECCASPAGREARRSAA